MATHSSVLAQRIPGMGSLVGCCLWGCTESDKTKVTQKQQQQQQWLVIGTAKIKYKEEISRIPLIFLKRDILPLTLDPEVKKEYFLNYYILILYIYLFIYLLQCVLVAQLCSSLCNPMYSLPGFSVHGILQARILEKAMAPHSSTLAWKIPWTEEPGGLQSMRLLRVGHD